MPPHSLPYSLPNFSKTNMIKLNINKQLEGIIEDETVYPEEKRVILKSLMYRFLKDSLGKEYKRTNLTTWDDSHILTYNAHRQQALKRGKELLK